jgi:hypothetical protein
MNEPPARRKTPVGPNAKAYFSPNDAQTERFGQTTPAPFRRMVSNSSQLPMQMRALPGCRASPW